MKRISIFLAGALLAVPALSPAQDAATEERLNKLSGDIQNIIERQAAQDKKIDDLIRDFQNFQQAQLNKPAADYASQEDLKTLAAKIQEVDRKRQEDNDAITETLRKLGKTIATTPTRRSQPVLPNDAGSPGTGDKPQKGFEYKVQSGDTLGAIIKACEEQKKVRLTLKQVLDANPGLKPEKMYVGQKIFIPLPE